MPDSGRGSGLDIDALVAKIRSEIERRSAAAPLSARPDALPPLAAIPELDAARMLTEQALRVADVGTAVPPFGGFGPVRRALARLLTRMCYFFLRVITVDQAVFNKLVLNALANIGSGVQRGDAALHAAVTEFRNEYLARLEAADAERHAAVRDLLGNLVRQMPELSTRLANLDQRVGLLQGQVVDLYRQVGGVTAQMPDVQARFADLSAQIPDLHDRVRQLADALTVVRAHLPPYNRRGAVLLESPRPAARPSSGPAVAPPEPSEDTSPCRTASYAEGEDALYVAFEEEFRGARDEISERQRHFLPIVRQASSGTEGSPVLDIGCGRGEWLEVLQQAGIEAAGVDLNPILVERCRRAGLNVAQVDAIAHLRSVAHGSLGAVTAFQVIEHLPFELFLDLVDETVRALRSGGVAIFETPNPENILVGSCTFYADPSHHRPIPPQVAKFFLESRGLANVDVLYLNPARPEQRITPEDSDIVRRFNQYFYGPRDFAVIGWKP
ncbi:MAG: methyltransferase domain-containing protein [Candidatus Binatia bacterium]